MAIKLSRSLAQAINYVVAHPSIKDYYLICPDKGPVRICGQWPNLTKDEVLNDNVVIISAVSSNIKVMGWHSAEYAGDDDYAESVEEYKFIV